MDVTLSDIIFNSKKKGVLNLVVLQNITVIYEYSKACGSGEHVI